MDVMIADTLSLVEVLDRLRERRPIFHAEADMQFALAWGIQGLAPDLHIRLERQLEQRARLDLLVASPDWQSQTAIELKYFTAKWSGRIDGEDYALAYQSAEDVRRYDFVKDITRVEAFVARTPGANGAVVAISNESSYWRPKASDRVTFDQAFRLSEGYQLTGELAWVSGGSLGSTKGRTEPLRLRGDYRCHWQPYSALAGAEANRDFRVLVVPIEPVA